MKNIRAPPGSYLSVVQALRGDFFVPEIRAGLV
jgi:hypothetical protein